MDWAPVAMFDTMGGVLYPDPDPPPISSRFVRDPPLDRDSLLQRATTRIECCEKRDASRFTFCSYVKENERRDERAGNEF